MSGIKEASIIHDYQHLIKQKMGYNPLNQRKKNEIQKVDYFKSFNDLKSLFNQHVKNLEGSISDVNHKISDLKKSIKSSQAVSPETTTRNSPLKRNIPLSFRTTNHSLLHFDNSLHGNQYRVNPFESNKRRGPPNSVLNIINMDHHKENVNSSETISLPKMMVKNKSEIFTGHSSQISFGRKDSTDLMRKTVAHSSKHFSRKSSVHRKRNTDKKNYQKNPMNEIKMRKTYSIERNKTYNKNSLNHNSPIKTPNLKISSTVRPSLIPTTNSPLQNQPIIRSSLPSSRARSVSDRRYRTKLGPSFKTSPTKQTLENINDNSHEKVIFEEDEGLQKSPTAIDMLHSPHMGRKTTIGFNLKDKSSAPQFIKNNIQETQKAQRRRSSLADEISELTWQAYKHQKKVIKQVQQQAKNVCLRIMQRRSVDEPPEKQIQEKIASNKKSQKNSINTSNQVNSSTLQYSSERIFRKAKSSADFGISKIIPKKKEKLEILRAKIVKLQAKKNNSSSKILTPEKSVSQIPALKNNDTAESITKRLIKKEKRSRNLEGEFNKYEEMILIKSNIPHIKSILKLKKNHEDDIEPEPTSIHGYIPKIRKNMKIPKGYLPNKHVRFDE